MKTFRKILAAIILTIMILGILTIFYVTIGWVGILSILFICGSLLAFAWAIDELL